MFFTNTHNVKFSKTTVFVCSSKFKKRQQQHFKISKFSFIFPPNSRSTAPAAAMLHNRSSKHVLGKYVLHKNVTNLKIEENAPNSRSTAP